MYTWPIRRPHDPPARYRSLCNLTYTRAEVLTKQPAALASRSASPCERHVCIASRRGKEQVRGGARRAHLRLISPGKVTCCNLSTYSQQGARWSQPAPKTATRDCADARAIANLVRPRKAAEVGAVGVVEVKGLPAQQREGPQRRGFMSTTQQHRCGSVLGVRTLGRGPESSAGRRCSTR